MWIWQSLSLSLSLSLLSCRCAAFTVGPLLILADLVQSLLPTSVDKDLLEPGCSVLLHHKSSAIIGVLSDDTDPMVNV